MTRILVTGARGFLGRAICARLESRGITDAITFSREEYDLTKEERIRALFKEKGPFTTVIHAAARAGGIGFNKENPGRIYYENIMMNTLMLEQSRLNNIKKFIGIGSVCEYPKYTSVPFKEESLWNGYPEETNAPYGFSKKSMLVQGQAYAQQYGFTAIHPLTVNLYGPHDDFNPSTSHVIPALIKKFQEAKKEGTRKVVLWGTGKPSREFLYVHDAAEGIILAMERYDKAEPVNLGSGVEISIKDLAQKIAAILDFRGDIRWDATKPDGQPRRCLDISKAEKEFGFKARTSLEEGLRETIQWYQSQIT